MRKQSPEISSRNEVQVRQGDRIAPGFELFSAKIPLRDLASPGYKSRAQLGGIEKVTGATDTTILPIHAG
jgi:hypothetical protein